MKGLVICVFLFVFLLQSCGDSPNECCTVSELLGKWQVYERGYSPGAGYITEPVPAEEGKHLYFGLEGRFFSNYEQLERYRYFEIEDDTASENHILVLFKSKLDKEPVRYSVIPQEGNSVELWFRFCIEGCHIGIRKVVSVSE